MSTQWSKPTRYIMAVSLALLGIFILYISRSVIPLLVIAALVAVIVRPAMLWLHRTARMPRGLAVALVYLAVAILVPLALVLAIPAVVDAVRYVLGLDYSSILRSVVDWLRSTLNEIKEWPLPEGGVNMFIDQAADSILAALGTGEVAAPADLPSVQTILRSLGTALSATFRTTVGVVGTVFSTGTLLLFTFLTSVYISLTAHTFLPAFMRMVPERFKPEVSTLLDRIGHMWNAFFRGQLTLMVVIGVLSWLGLTILGVPGAVYLGIVAGLLELIPNLGPVIATIPAVIVALLQGSSYLPVSPLIFALIVIGFYILIQQLENNLIVPRVLGGAVNLPALVVLTGVLVGAEVAGLLGALLATPVIATGREVIGYVLKKIQGEDPYPPGELEPEELERQPGRLQVWIRKTVHQLKPEPKEILPQTGSPRAGEPGAQIFPVDEEE